MSFKDALLGVAIGDAFGLGLEFRSREWIKQHIDFTRYVNAHEMPFGEHIEPGFYSDDTEHTIGLTKALLDQREFTQELLLEYWTNEYLTDKQEKGYPRKGHGSIKNFYEGKQTIAEVRDGQRNRDDPGNAPPMRAVPLGFVPDNKINEYAIINADATHPHPKGRAASIIVARGVEHLIVKKDNQQDILKYALTTIDEKDTIDALQAADKLPAPHLLMGNEYETLLGPQPMQFPPVKGWQIYGLPCAAMRTAVTALYIIKHSQTAFDGLKGSIRMGGDIDSLAAIVTGALAGRFGLESLPKYMLEQVEGRQKLEALADRFETDYLYIQHKD